MLLRIVLMMSMMDSETRNEDLKIKANKYTYMFQNQIKKKFSKINKSIV